MIHVRGTLEGAKDDDTDRVARFWSEFGRLVARYSWAWEPAPPLPPRQGLIELPEEPPSWRQKLKGR